MNVKLICFYKGPIHNQLSKIIMLYPVICDPKFLFCSFFLIFKTLQICTDKTVIQLRQRRKMNNVGNIIINQNLISTELTHGV